VSFPRSVVVASLAALVLVSAVVGAFVADRLGLQLGRNARRHVERIAGHGWACGDDFTLADCAAAPSLFYADWAHEIPSAFGNVRAYRARLLARPTIARAVDEGRPYRGYFPLGAPNRD